MKQKKTGREKIINKETKRQDKKMKQASNKVRKKRSKQTENILVRR
jgi:hypothetical protein